MRVCVTGGTGLIGRRLIPALRSRKHDVVLVTRSTGPPRSEPGTSFISGDPTHRGEWQAALGGCDAVVNLVGEPLLARRWNTEHKQRVLDSRVLATRNVVEAIGRPDVRCKTLVNASAIGYYGSRGDTLIDEATGPGSDYLAKVCMAWEQEAVHAAQYGARAVCIRIGVVLDPAGGALAQMVPVFRRFAGGPVGSGNQWLSWVHHADLVGLLCMALEDANLSGPINATSPNPVTNREFAKALGRALGRPAIVRVPAMVLRLAMGEAADVVLSSQRVKPRVAMERDYCFRFTDIARALNDLVAQV